MFSGLFNRIKVKNIILLYSGRNRKKPLPAKQEEAAYRKHSSHLSGKSPAGVGTVLINKSAAEVS